MLDIKVKVGRKEYSIRSDRFNYMIGYEAIIQKGGRKGEKTFVPESYYSDLNSLITAIIDKKIKASDTKTLRGLQRNITKYRNELMDLYSIATKEKEE